ncbi:MAG: gas vesicle protein [Nanoarchaeota archaeon]|nr:gas vesicle protein [Nanoarchaeota archaeon]
MEPTREVNATLVDLLDRVLEKGLVINADIIISVAGVPLVGINLKAALAGMETMLKYGMMKDWDQAQRAIARVEQVKIPLLEGEEVMLKTFGSLYYSEGIYSAWRKGQVYVTNKRVLLFRKEPEEMLFKANINRIKNVTNGKEGDNEELHITLNDNNIIKLHSNNSKELKNAIQKRIMAIAT